MKFKKLAVLSFLALNLALGVMIVGVKKGSAASTLTVGNLTSLPCTGTYSTISAAVAAASNGDTIQVCQGTYNENVNVNLQLTINGAQAGNAVGGRTFGSGGESTVNGQVTVQATNVTIDGFSLTNPGQSSGILIKTAGDNALITNNIVDTIGAASLNANTQAIYLENGPDNVSVVGNSINNVTGLPSSNGGIFIGDSTSGNPSLNILIKGNSISNITSVLRGAYAIHVNNGASTAPSATGYTTVEIRNNTINNLVGGGWAHAIGLEGDTPGVIVVDNDISNVTAPGIDRIAVWFEDNPSFATGEVHTNNFNDGLPIFGIAVQPTLSGGPVDGACNWWGSASGPGPIGPGTGAKVTAKVTYAPWLISPAPGGACIGGNVVTNKDQCKGDGWKTRVRSNNTPFKNQGDCIQYVNTGK